MEIILFQRAARDPPKESLYWCICKEQGKEMVEEDEEEEARYNTIFK